MDSFQGDLDRWKKWISPEAYTEWCALIDKVREPVEASGEWPLEHLIPVQGENTDETYSEENGAIRRISERDELAPRVSGIINTD